MSPPSPAIAPEHPIVPAQRSIPLDVLRGVAVLGILVMNIRNFGLPLAEFNNPKFPDGDASTLDLVCWGVANVFFEDKMIAIFSMLFGAGMILMADRARVIALRRAALHYRRMLWLFVIGLVHAYGLWYGDILNTYATCGALLYPLKNLRPGMLIALGILSLCATVGLRQGPGAYAALAPRNTAASAPARESAGGRIMRESMAGEQAAYRGSYMDLARWRANLNTAWHFLAGIEFSIWRSTGYMLIGMGLLRLGVLTGSRPAGDYAALAIGGYAVGLTLVLLGFAPQLARVLGTAPEYAPEARRAIGLLAGPMRFLGAGCVALGHVGLVMLICRGLAGSAALAPLAAVGRMALTNYLMQTAIAVVIFDGWGLGQWARWSIADLTALVLAIWGVQLVLSPIWLRFFRFGPLEWAWRSLTYWRPQPFRRERAAARPR